MANTWLYEQTKLLIALWSEDLDLSFSVLRSYPWFSPRFGSNLVVLSLNRREINQFLIIKLASASDVQIPSSSFSSSCNAKATFYFHFSGASLKTKP